jgi:hypothetical protein
MRKQATTDRVRGSHVRRAGTMIAAVAGAGLFSASAAGGVPAGAGGGFGARVAAGVAGVSAGVAGQPALAAAAAVGATVNCGGISIGASDRGRPVADSERAGPAEVVAQALRLAEWNRKSPYERASWRLVPATADTAMLIARLPGHLTYVPAYKRDDGHWQMGPPCPA